MLSEARELQEDECWELYSHKVIHRDKTNRTQCLMETVSVWEDRKVLEAGADAGSALIHTTELSFRWCRGF